MHDVFLQRYTESLQQQAFPISEARIFSSASPPPEEQSQGSIDPSDGGSWRIILGVAIGTFREMMNRSLYTREQVETRCKSACISIVPRRTSEDSALSSAKPGCCPIKIRRFKGRRNCRNPHVFWTVLNSPLSRFAEAIRSIKLAIDLSNGLATPKRSSGSLRRFQMKGSRQLHRASRYLWRRRGRRVILVDCDLRNPSLSRKLAPDAEHGIIDVIAGKAALEKAIWTDRSTNLKFLPCRERTRVAHSSDFLASDATKGLFEDLRREYDYVLVDLSPLMPVVDARATPFCGSLYFRCRVGTHKELTL